MSSVREKRAEIHKAEARAAEKLRVEGGNTDKVVDDVESTPSPKAQETAKKKAPPKKKAAPKAKSQKKSK
tara:strand:- start:107 stop:316 length:210 start_codon:yes stop_codon:yes gene_type:complete